MIDTEHNTIAEAVATAAARLGLTPQELRDITRHCDDAALLLVRCEQALTALTGGDALAMRHWMRTRNEGTGGVPAEKIAIGEGLRGIVEYLEALARTG